MNETHTWMDHGNYVVAVRVTDFLGYWAIDTLRVTVNDLVPSADFFWHQGAPEEGDTVNFQDNSTSYPDNIIGYLWNFSGLGTSTAMNPAFTFINNGNYTVTLTVTDEDNSEDTISKVINIADKDPVSGFSAAPLTGEAPLTVNFTDESESYDGIISYTWDFGDGNTATGTAPPPHTYNAVGTYTVSLTIAEGDWDTDTAIKDNYVTVGCTNNDECLTGAYCQKAIGDCDGQGGCTDRPASCPEGWDPVCGCDGETYTNACKAAEVGINIGYIGECKGLANSAWPCKGHDSKRTGQSPYVGSQTSTLYWTYAIGTPVKSSPAIDANGIIYIGSDDGNLYALNPDGSLKWDYQTNGANNYSSPAIDADGTIYIGSNDGNVYAFNADGSLKWGYQTVSASLNSSPAIGAAGTIYISGSSPGRVYALNPNAGDPNDRLKWSYETGADTFVSPAIDANGIIYIGCSLGILHALDPNAGDPNDRLKWSYETGFEIASAPAIGEDGTIYIGNAHGRVYALNDDGTLKWSHQTGGQIIRSSPAIGADGTIYIGCGDGIVYALDEDGTLKWSYQTGTEYIYSSPAIGSDGTVYVGGNDGKIYAFGEDKPCYMDMDHDGYGDPDQVIQASACPSGYVDDNSDCNDKDGSINPGAHELCDEKDNDCDGLVDEEGAKDCTNYYLDKDKDGYGVYGDIRCLCAPEGNYSAILEGDSDDLDPNISHIHMDIKLDLPAGWSMISVPVIPYSTKISYLFPGAVVVYGYKNNVGYLCVPNEEGMEFGKGYWILLDKDQSYNLSGRSINEYALSVHRDGWLMIGGCTNSAQPFSDNCTIGVIYGFVPGVGYQSTETVEPGKGYWILLNDTADRATVNLRAHPKI